MVILILGIIIGFLFSIVAIVTGILLSKTQTFNNIIQKTDEIIRPKGMIFEEKDPIDKVKEDLIKNNEAVYEDN